MDALEEQQKKVVVKYKPTYRLEPLEERKFSSAATRKICEDVLKERLVDVVWDEDECKDLSLNISDEIREKVKAQDYSRYKIIVQCTIGENKQQGVLITSRCLWEPNTDNYAAASFKNDQVWANVMVFCCYTY